MSKYVFNIVDFNPDGMSLVDLCNWLNYLFSDPGENRVAHSLQIPITDIGNMKKYLVNKICAMQHRKDGNINFALELEKFCDEIYKDFSAKVVW